MLCDEPDLLAELIQEWTQRDPDFPALVEAASQRILLMRALGDVRRHAGLSKAAVAARLDVTQAELTSHEMGETDPPVSTLERWAAALGYRLELRLVPRDA